MQDLGGHLVFGDVVKQPFTVCSRWADLSAEKLASWCDSLPSLCGDPVEVAKVSRRDVNHAMKMKIAMGEFGQ
jgi:hypothetical protein